MGFELVVYPAALLVRALPLPDIYSHNSNLKKKLRSTKDKGKNYCCCKISMYMHTKKLRF